MNRLAIVSNAGSGRNRRRSELLRVPDALTDLLVREPDLIAVNGGDGTVQAVLSAWARLRDAGSVPEALPPLAVLPAGSTNMTAHDLGCGGRLTRRVGDLLALRVAHRYTDSRRARPRASRPSIADCTSRT